MSKEDKIIADLKMLDMTEYEARAYIGLLKNNPVTRYELAKSSGVPLPKIYETLDKMVANNWAMAIEGSPAKYVPLDIDNFLNINKRKYDSALFMLGKELPRVQKAKEQDYVWNLNEYERIISIAKDMICEAEKTIYLSIWKDEATLLKKTLNEDIHDGVKIVSINFGDFVIDKGINYNHGQQFYKKSERWLLAVIDEKRTVTGWTDDKGAWLGVWTENRGLVLLTLEYIKHDIYLWKLFNRYHDKLERTFGKNYALLKNVIEDKDLLE